LSDTHFGLNSSTLADKDKVDLLAWEIREYGHGCERVVLLGDIFDFWRARPEKAIRDSKYFFSKLIEMEMKASYVVGNHDHHLTIMYQESEFLERIARGDVYSVYSPNLKWSRTINGLSLDMRYPTCTVRCLNRSFLLTHGHHLDGVQAFTLQLVEKLRKLSGEELSPADLEMMMAYAYESIYRSSYIGEMAELEEKIWRVSSRFSKAKDEALKPFRPTPIESHYDSILKFIKGQHVGRVDCFIYGDTHKAGAYSREGGPLVVNIGSFTGENRSHGHRDVHDTYLVLSDDGLELRQLGRQNPLIASNGI
jgi:predicted phosphodiesterase